MTLRITQRELVSLLVSIVFVLPVLSAFGQEAAPQQAGQEPDKTGAATSQPAPQPESQEALEKLKRIGEELERKNQGQKSAGGGASQPAATSQPAGPGAEAPDREGTSRPSLEELKRQARASARQRALAARGVEGARGDIPPDFIGPPGYLADVGAPVREPDAGVVAVPLGPEEAGAEPDTAAGAAGVPGEAVTRRPPAEAEANWFNFVNASWEQVVIPHFVERIGKPLMGVGDLIIGGELTYVSDRKFTKEEAIDELNLLLHQQGYRFVEEEHHIYVVPLSEMPQKVELKYVFESLEAFELADPRDMDYVVVYYKVEDQPAQLYVETFGDALPDYTRLSALEESNQIKIVALARDVRKFLALKDLIDITPSDPRKMKIFDIETNATDIERRVRDFLDLGGGPLGFRMVRDPRTGRMIPQRTGGRGDDESGVQMVADERTNSIIVKATQDKIDEIEKLIETLDQKPPIGEFRTEVHPVKHADAAEVANLLNQILQQEQGQTQTPSWQIRRQIQQRLAQQARQRRSGQPTPRQIQPQQIQPGMAPEDILYEGIFERAKKTIRLVADTRTNSLIVYANEEGQMRVRELLENIDKPLPDTFQTFAVEHAEVAKIAPLVTQIAQGMTEAGLRGGQAPSIVPDAANNVFHVIAERAEMEKIEKLIQQLDVPGEEQERHVVELKNLRPSDVAQMVQTLLKKEGVSATPSFRGAISRRIRGRVRMTPSVSASPTDDFQVIPLDEAQILIVICSEADWQKIEQTIKTWDERAITSTPQLQTFTIENGNPQSIASTLSGFYGRYEHPLLGRAPVAVQAEGDKILVYGVRPAIEEIEALIESLDVASEADKVEILPLSHADATQVAQQLQMMFAGATIRGRFSPGAAAGPRIQAEPVTNSLIVQANKADLERIKDFAQRMDEKVAAQLPEQKFFTLRYATPREVAQAVSTMFSGGLGGAGSRFRGAAVGTQVTAVASGPQVIIKAPKEKMAEIEAFIKQLDDPKGNEIVIQQITMPGADVNQIARKLTTAFRQKKNIIAVFDADTSSETILLTCSRDVLEEALKLTDEYKSIGAEFVPQVEFVTLKHAQASEASGWLREQLVAQIQKTAGRGAAAQVKVTADQRTNRVIINAPQVAVKLGLTLLEQYDVESLEPPPETVIATTYKLPGLDVANLASSLNRVYASRPRRPDGLRAVFNADRVTENLIVSAPRDMLKDIEELIDKFKGETEDLELIQAFIEIKNADASYIQSQLQGQLSTLISSKRGSEVARRINVTVDSRLNRVILNAPKFVHPIAENLIQQLDQVATRGAEIRTIPLEIADANTVVSILNNVLRDKIRTKRTLQISVEPMTNSLIVTGDQEDFQEIEKWAKELDEKAITAKGELKIIELLNANPWEVYGILDSQFRPKRGQRNKLGQEITFSILAGRSMVVQAPADKMVEIEELIARLDTVGSKSQVEVRTYELPGIGSGIHDLARQVTNAMNQTAETRERRITMTPYPAADTLIVTAQADQFERIEEMMDKFKAMVEKETTVTKFIELEYLDAGRYAGTIQNMLANKISKEGRRGSRGLQNLQITPDPRTNRLICYLPEKIVPDLEEVIAFLDVEPLIKEGELRTIELAYADANTVAGILQPMFVQTRRTRRSQDYSQIEVKIQAEPITNSLIVTASDEDFEQIKAKALEIDEGAITRRTDPELIKLEFADPWQIYNVVSNAFTESGGGWGRKRNIQREVQVQVVGSQLLVQAPKEKLQEVKDLIKKLDVADTGGIVVKTFVLPGMGWELNNLAGQIQRILQTMEPPTRQQRGRASVSAYPQADTLIAAVPADQMEKVEELIEQFIGTAGDMTPFTKFYTLVYARANEIVGTLNTIVQQRVGRARGQRAQQQISVVADPRTNRLVVIAPEQLQAEVAKVIESLDVEPDDVSGTLRAIPLVNADASMVANTLRPLFQEKAQRERANKSYIPVTLTPETITNTLLVYGGDEQDQKVLGEQIARIDSDMVENEFKPVTVGLQYADPNQIAQMIDRMFGTRGRRGSAEQQNVEVTVTNGLLVVKAPKKKLDDILALVEEVDAPDPTGDMQIKTFDLKVLNATQVMAAVQLFLRDLQKTRRAGELSPGAFAEPTTNTLVVIAPGEHMPFIEALITDLELKKPKEAVSQAYVLKNVRAEQIANNVDSMLKIKVIEKEGVKKTSVQTAVFADAASNRLFVFAPDEYQKLAGELIRMVDEEVETGEIVHIIPLENGDAQQLAQVLGQMIQGGQRGGRGAGAGNVRIAADVGSNSILLGGLPKDVAEVEAWLTDLELNSVRIPEMQIFVLENAATYEVEDTLRGLFPPTRNPQDTVTVTADEYSGRLIVTANKRKMRQVEKFISQLDSPPDYGAGGLLGRGGRELYFVDISRGSASNIAWDVRDRLPDEDRGGPSIEADWFGEYITVECRPSEFPQILKLIREYERRAKPEIVHRVYDAKGGDREAMIAYLLTRTEGEGVSIERLPERPKMESLVEELWPEGEEPQSVKEKREKAEREKAERGNTEQEKPERGGRRIAPFDTGLPLWKVLLDDIEEELFGEAGKPAAARSATDEDEPSAKPTSAPAAQDKPAVAKEEGDEPGMGFGQTIPSPLEKEPTRFVEQPDGTFLIVGNRDDVDDITDVLDIFVEDTAAGEVIRIFKFKYGDVSAAAEVLSIMFDVRQRQVVIQQPQQQQQRGRQQGQQGQQGRQGDQQRGQQAGLLEQLRGMVGGRQAGARGQTRAGPSMRIATDPGHNYLIVKCQETLLPEIRQLLRELDIPPGEVNVKIFQLKNLLAEETAQNIKDVLGISKAQERRGTRRMPTPRAGVNPQQQLIEMLQQQMVSVPGVEGGAKVERVEIVPNAVTNSLMVSAPPEVMELIENVINKLEDLQAHDIVGIYHYELQLAKVDDVLPLLQEIFAATAASGRPGRGRPGLPGGGGSPAALGPVTISGDPRNNTIIFTAEAKDVEVVEAQIRLLDIKGSIAEAETYFCQYGDATAIATVVEAIYGDGAAGRPTRRGPPGGAPSMGGQDVRIVAEATTNTIVVWGPPDKRDLIFAKIKELDLGSERNIREIDVIHADAEELADKLTQMFGGAGATAAGMPGRRGARSGMPSTGPVLIMGDKNSKKLLVRAPEPVFRQIEEVVAVLDQPTKDMEMKRYQLRYADAESVVETVRGALTEYIQMQFLAGGARGGFGAGGLPFDPFTVVPDKRTNSILVVGSQQTFTWVESVLATIDVETPADQRKEFRVFVLDKADAETVAQMINDYAAGESTGTTGARRTSMRGMRGMRGMMGGGTTTLSARELDVFAVADTTANTVMVVGRPDDIDVVEKEIIAQVEDKIRDRFEIATIPVKQVKPTEIVAYIWQFVGEPQAQATGRPGGARRTPRGGAAGEQAGPQIIPNDNNNTLVVRGTKRDIEYVRELVEQFDNPSMTQQNIKVVKVPLGQDVVSLADRVAQVVNDSEEEIATASGRRARRVSIAPDEYTNSLIVAGEPAMFGFVTSVIEQLADIKDERMVTQVIQLKNVSAEDFQRMVDELQRRRGASGGRRSTPVRAPTRRPSGRRGALTPEQMPGVPAPPLAYRPSAWIEPCVGFGAFSPLVGVMLVDGLVGDDGQDGEVRPRVRGGSDQLGLRAAQRRALQEVEEELLGQAPDEPQEPLPGLTGVSGELRGEVAVAAVDAKRIIIMGDESDVAFILQVLAMMEQSTSPAVIEVFPIQKAKATVLAPIVEAAIKSQIDVRKADERFSISAEGRSNSLIVSASEAMMEEIAALIEQLDVEKMEGTQSRMVALEHMRAIEAVAILRPAIEELSKLREVPKESQASIRAIERNNSVMIVGTPTDVEEIEGLVKMIDVALRAEDEKASFVRADVIVIPLKNGNAANVAKVLMDMIEEQQENALQAGGDKPGKPFVKILQMRMADGRVLPELDLERPIGIIPEEGTNSLIIFSSAKNTEALTEIVGVFDTLPIGADTEVKAFALRYAAAEEVAQLIEDIFEDKSYVKRPSEGDSKGLDKGVMPPVPPGVAARGLPYPLVVQHDVRSNTVVVIGRSDAVLLAGGLIAELDRPTMELGVKAHVVELKRMPATQLAEKLETLLDDRAKALGGDKNEARDSAVIQPEERTNALIVFATEEVYGMIEDLALQLDAAEKYSVADLRYRPLEYADAPKLQGMLQEMFDNKTKVEQQTNKESTDVLNVLADTRSNSLLLTGTRDYLDEAEALIAELDQKFDGPVLFRTYKVKLNSAPNIASLLEEMIDKALAQQDSKLKGTPIHVSADPISDSLLIAAAREDMELIERWVEILDRPSEVGRMTLVVPLGRGSAEEVAAQVQDIFKQPGGQKGEFNLTVTHDATSNSLVAFGPPTVLKDIEDFVRQLDTTEPRLGTVVRIFKLEQADAEDAGDLLSRILELRGGTVGGRGGGTTGGSRQEAEKQVMMIFQREHPEIGLETLKAMRADVQVIADVRTNSLYVTAPAQSMELMEALVVAVDVPPDAAKIRVFHLRNADAEQMVETLEGLFERRAAGTTGRGAGAEESERVLSLAEGLGVEGGRQEVAFTTDVRTNSVIAAGTRGYLDLVEELILQLDTIPIKERETFVYSPLNLTAEELAPSIREFSEAEQARLQEIGEEVSIAVRQERQVVAIANEEANRVIIDVDPRFRDSIMRVVSELDQPPPQVMIQVLIVEVTMDNELDLGVEFAFQDLQYAKAGPTDTTTFDYVGGTDIGAAGSGLGGFTFTITGADFNFLFRALQNEGSLRVLSRPQIVAMDNQEAFIDISDDVPYVTGTSTSIAGQISTSVSRERIGIKLTVTPQINPDGFVRMQIRQEVSDFTGSTVDVGQGVTAPVFFRREAETNIMVKDNETVVLGGLITSRAENREQKVPLIGDIPGLGLLFRNQTDSTRRTELLLILTPHVIREVEDYRRLSLAQRDQLSAIPGELLESPLMQGLRASPEKLPGIGEDAEPSAVPRETPTEVESPKPAEGEYGPVRPTPRANPTNQGADPGSYDVPLTLNSRPRR